MNLRLLLALALSIPVASACFYDDDDCLNKPTPLEDPIPLPSLRNPNNGQCETFGNGGGGGGGNTCGDYDTQPAGQQAPIFVPDWGVCYQGCESLSEDDCLAADQCRGSYLPDPNLDSSVIIPVFNECWSISTDGPYSTEGCSTYGAEECARHNECIAVHGFESNGGSEFYFCDDEPNQADPGSCLGQVACPTLAPECPIGTVAGIIDSCWSGFCIPLDQCDQVPTCDTQDETSCVDRSDCDPIYQGVNCVCDGDECVCERWDYESCETA